MPSITAPLSRYLSVADIDRTIAFYRDVLGFEPRDTRDGHGLEVVAEVTRGPARIQLGTNTTTLDSTGQVRPRGAAILFFEVDDVGAFRDEIVARGGTPSEMEKVNWIKLRVFQLHDPDGHTLWFAHTFQQPDRERPEPLVQQALPMLPCSNVAAAIAYYGDVLGFRINYSQDDLGVMYRDAVTLLLVQRTPAQTGIGACEFYVHDADVLYAEFMAKGATAKGPPVSMPWGLRTFTVIDLERNELTFAQTFE